MRTSRAKQIANQITKKATNQIIELPFAKNYSDKQLMKLKQDVLKIIKISRYTIIIDYVVDNEEKSGEFIVADMVPCFIVARKQIGKKYSFMGKTIYSKKTSITSKLDYGVFFRETLALQIEIIDKESDTIDLKDIKYHL